MKKTLFTIAIYALLILLALAGIWWFMKKASSSVSIQHTTRIDKTPEEVTQIRRIRQWEFLSVTTEEMVDTTQNSFWGDKVLCRIYAGTLRIGIDMDKAGDNWFEAKDSTAVLKLPAPGLLDSHFIDEARTRSFYEKGNWDKSVLDILYKKAETRMKQRALTPENMAAAEANGRQTFTRLFQSFGYKKVEVSFVK